MLAAMAAARQLLALLVFLPQLAASADTASSLSAALAPYPALSTFQQLVDKHASTVDALVPPRNSSAGRLDVTVLAPSNQAFETYILQNGPLTNLSASALKNFLSYHILVAPLSSANLSSDDHPRGLTVPTLLTPELYNNRSAGQGLTASYGKNATGQVVYVQQQLPGSTGSARSESAAARKRQGVGTVDAQLQAGLAQTVDITMLDIRWSRGYIQMVDE